MAVILLLILSAGLLHAMRKQLDDSLKMVASENRFIRQYALAASALAWGEQLSWGEQGDRWMCRTESSYGWRACLMSLPSGELILRGDGGANTLAHFQWVARVSETTNIIAVRHGWIDYCPLVDNERCQANE